MTTPKERWGELVGAYVNLHVTLGPGGKMYYETNRDVFVPRKISWVALDKAPQHTSISSGGSQGQQYPKATSSGAVDMRTYMPNKKQSNPAATSTITSSNASNASSNASRLSEINAATRAQNAIAVEKYRQDVDEMIRKDELLRKQRPHPAKKTKGRNNSRDSGTPSLSDHDSMRPGPSKPQSNKAAGGDKPTKPKPKGNKRQREERTPTTDDDSESSEYASDTGSSEDDDSDQ